ncbi:ABC transporter, solute-binding protein [Clostridiales bacterium oral taxon 876 str. F0540]|nr:ABC transporter, solute-binding protein [Clostridiales bacterium oral taxon 876 str. F0540]
MNCKLRTNRIISLILIIFLCITSYGCQKKNSAGESKDKALNVYVDVKDKNSLNIIKFLTEEYKKENPKSKIKVNDVLGTDGNIEQDISKGTEADVVITNRNTMMELARKGLISDMGQYYEKNKIGDKFYNVVSSYGRIREKYYGIGLLPYTMEIFYNTDALSKLGVIQPTSIKDMEAVIKKFTASNIKIPIVIGEDLDINTALSSVAASNIIKVSDLDNIYDNKEEYKNKKEMQGIFDGLNLAAKYLSINKNLFELGNESTFTSLTNGSIPLVISTSYYYSQLKEGKIGVVEDYSVLNNQKGTVPVIINSIISIPSNGKNSEEAGKLVKFILDEKTQEKLVKKGFITGSKKSNEKLSGIGASIEKHLLSSSDNNIVYIYSLPKKFKGPISSKVDNILSGKYTGSEWQDIVNEVYK